MIKLTDKQINDALAGTKYDEEGKCFGSITYLGLGVRNCLNDAEINAARAIILNQMLDSAREALEWAHNAIDITRHPNALQKVIEALEYSKNIKDE